MPVTKIIAKSDLGLNNVDNTSDANKPVSTAQAAAIAGKADIAHTHSKAQVGLDQVDNTADANKPISTAAAAALSGKAAVSHTHTKAEVGLNNVDNTSDANKPISTAAAAAIALKANAANVYTKSEVDALIAGVGVGTGGTTTTPDLTPNPFSFVDVANAALGTLYTSNTITVSGVTAPTGIAITGGTYAVNGGAYTASSGSVSGGDTVSVRVTSSATNSISTSATLTIGGVSDTFTVTTLAATSSGIITTEAALRAKGDIANAYIDVMLKSGARQWVIDGSTALGGGSVQGEGGGAYYDRPETFHRLADLTGDTTWRTRADALNNSLIAYWEPLNWGSSFIMQWANARGLYRHWTRNGSVSAKNALGKIADYSLSPYQWAENAKLTGDYIDSRIMGRTLMIFIYAGKAGSTSSAYLTNAAGTWRQAQDTQLNNILLHQSTDGAFRYPGPNGTYNYCKPFMDMIVCEALIEYWEQVAQDSRIPVAVKNCLDYHWANQWNAAAGGFRYAEAVPVNTSEVTTPAPDLNMFFTSPFSWYFKYSNDTTYRDKADLIFVEGLSKAYWNGGKQYNEQAYGSYRHIIEYRGGAAIPTSRPNLVDPDIRTWGHTGLTITAPAGLVGPDGVTQAYRVSGLSGGAGRMYSSSGLSVGETGTFRIFAKQPPSGTVSPKLEIWAQDQTEATVNASAIATLTTSWQEIKLSGELLPWNGTDVADYGLLVSIGRRTDSSIAGDVDIAFTAVCVGTDTSNIAGVMTLNDTTPDAFSFTNVSNAALSTVYTSNTIIVSGINAPAAISITGGAYSKNGGAFISTAGTVTNGDTVAVRVTSSASNATSSTAVLSIGGVLGQYSVTTPVLAGSGLTYTPTSSATFTDYTYTSASPVTVPAQSIGTAAANRRVVASIISETGSGFSSITIGGVTATIHATTSRAFIASAIVPTGTTADVVLTMNGGANNLGPLYVKLGTIYGANGTTPVATTGVAEFAYTAASVGPLTVPTGGVGVVVLGGMWNAITLSGVTTDEEKDAPTNGGLCAVFGHANSTFTATAANDAANGSVMAAAVFQL